MKRTVFAARPRDNGALFRSPCGTEAANDEAYTWSEYIYESESYYILCGKAHFFDLRINPTTGDTVRIEQVRLDERMKSGGCLVSP